MTTKDLLRPIPYTLYPIPSREAIFLFLFLIFLPFQTRRVLFVPQPFNEWHAVFLYASDILFLALLVVASLNVMSGNTLRAAKVSLFDKKVLCTLALFFVWAVFSAFYNGFHNFSAYHILKLAEGSILFLYFFFRFPQIFSWRLVAWAVVFDAVVQSIIAALQFILQRSLGLWFFRESILAAGDHSVAQIVVHGVRMIRAYGTFPSPNVLAAFLAIALFFLYGLLWPPGGKLRAYALYGVQFFLLAGLFLSFSRAILLLFLVVSAGAFITQHVRTKENHWRNLALVWLAEVLTLIVIFFPELSGRFEGVGLAQEAALSERFLFNVIALQIIQFHPFFGVGIGNFVSSFQAMLPGLRESLYQPVHNILLLIAAEMGIPALLFFVGFLALLVVRAAKIIIRGGSYFYIFFCGCAVFIFLVGMEDHLFWTIQQTTLLFWIILGMVGGYSREHEENV